MIYHINMSCYVRRMASRLSLCSKVTAITTTRQISFCSSRGWGGRGGGRRGTDVIPFRMSSYRYSPLLSCCRWKSTTPNPSNNYSSEEQSLTKNKQSILQNSSHLKRLLDFFRPERTSIAGAVGFLLISSSVTMSVPFFIGKLIDMIYTASEEGRLETQLHTMVITLTGVFIIGALANFGRLYLIQSSGQRIIRNLRHALYAAIIKQEMAFFDKTRTGELINRLSSDTALVGQSLTYNISDGLRALFMTVAGVSLMFYMSPVLASSSLLIVPPIAIIAGIFGRYLRRVSQEVQDRLADSTQVAEERLSNMRTVRALAKESLEVKRFDSHIDDVLTISLRESLLRSGFFMMTGLSGNMIVLSVFYVGGLMMNDSAITVGQLSSFLLYAASVGISIGGLGSFYSELMKGLGATTRIWELMDRHPSIPTTDGLHIDASTVKGDIALNDVTFQYPARPDVRIFNNLNVVIPAGQVTAVVGASGSGKSSIGSLLLRLYDPNEGYVTLDNKDIRQYNPTSLRNLIGTVNQEPILFSTTIADNIAYGASDPSTVSDSDITEVARQANALGFIEDFPEGFQTVVGERGHMLSGGQRQRIAIARAIIKNPKILILDEATSALDAESEYLVKEALERLMVGRTVLTIAHRLSTIKNAANILVLSNGAVAEMGNYEQLMSTPEGIFRRLVERQTTDFIE